MYHETLDSFYSNLSAQERNAVVAEMLRLKRTGAVNFGSSEQVDKVANELTERLIAKRKVQGADMLKAGEIMTPEQKKLSKRREKLFSKMEKQKVL